MSCTVQVFPLGTGAEPFATHAPRRWGTFSFEEEAADDVGFHGQVVFLLRPVICQSVV